MPWAGTPDSPKFTEQGLRPEDLPGEGTRYLIGSSLFAGAVGLLTLVLVHQGAGNSRTVYRSWAVAGFPYGLR
ncbi:hypothetical protein [Streptomyces atroolivaceus]|uniref:hypothetical protein n=1 Tax=Streptomyces atroolivaceus TaxID=66869 RepID=UPI000B165C7C|nr:hypothetical protein [Streptomyces atroolivaceus]